MSRIEIDLQYWGRNWSKRRDAWVGYSDALTRRLVECWPDCSISVRGINGPTRVSVDGVESGPDVERVRLVIADLGAELADE